jgi:hypothetical protein
MFLVDPKVFRFVVKGVKAILLGVQRGGDYYTYIGQCWIFTSHFYAMFWQPFGKRQTSWKCRIAPLMVTYHHVKIYVSIIIQSEVININVRNFKFPIGLNYRTEFHEIWWSYRYMFLVDPKVFRFVVKGVKAILLGVQRGGDYYRILWERWNFVITSQWIMIET